VETGLPSIFPRMRQWLCHELYSQRVDFVLKIRQQNCRQTILAWTRLSHYYILLYSVPFAVYVTSFKRISSLWSCWIFCLFPQLKNTVLRALIVFLFSFSFLFRMCYKEWHVYVFDSLTGTPSSQYNSWRCGIDTKRTTYTYQLEVNIQNLKKKKKKKTS